MLYKKSYSVPANTATASPNHQRLQISKGRITGWIVFSPEEAADLLRLRVEYHGAQIFPFSGSEWAYGLFIPQLIPDDIAVEESPYFLDIYAINQDDSYAHEYNIHVIIEPEVTMRPSSSATAAWFDRFANIFGGG